MSGSRIVVDQEFADGLKSFSSLLQSRLPLIEADNSGAADEKTKTAEINSTPEYNAIIIHTLHTHTHT